jgi:hypothetical protein
MGDGAQGCPRDTRLVSNKVYGALAAMPYCAVVGLIGFGLYQAPLQPAHVAAPTPIVAEAPEGPRCTIRYPRGFKMTKKMRKHPTCHMDVDGIVWGYCTPRSNA